MDPDSPKDIEYVVEDEKEITPDPEQASVFFNMNLECSPTGYLATKLEVQITFYQNGILYANINEEG